MTCSNGRSRMPIDRLTTATCEATGGTVSLSIEESTDRSVDQVDHKHPFGYGLRVVPPITRILLKDWTDIEGAWKNCIARSEVTVENERCHRCSVAACGGRIVALESIRIIDDEPFLEVADAPAKEAHRTTPRPETLRVTPRAAAANPSREAHPAVKKTSARRARKNWTCSHWTRPMSLSNDSNSGRTCSTGKRTRSAW